MVVSSDGTRRFSVWVALVALIMSVANGASAGTRDYEPVPNPDEPRLVEAGLTLVGIDEATAQANGFKVVELADGRRATVPESDHRRWYTEAVVMGLGGAVEPAVGSEIDEGRFSTNAYDSVSGNCGVTWVEIRDTGYKQYTVNTGFWVTNGWSAVSFTWRVDASGSSGGSNNYTYDHWWGGGLWFRTEWSGSETVSIPWSDTITVGTNSFWSSVLLSNGGVCFVGHAVASTWVN